MKEKNNNHPYIIAVGESMDNITQNFIEVEKHLMCVSYSCILCTEYLWFMNAHLMILMFLDSTTVRFYPNSGSIFQSHQSFWFVL